MRYSLVLLFVFACWLCAAVGEPVARWHFEPGHAERNYVGGVKAVSGPNSEVSMNLSDENYAAYFDGKGSVVRVADSDLFRFGNGDAITLEAWVRREGKAATPYIVGKGRLGKGEENQGFALRLMKVSDRYRVSFLFRSRATAIEAGAFHRWNSDLGIRPGKLWHHVAIRYRFGDPASVCAFINGKKSAGTWDLGGETDRPPVADDADVWIGSSQGGASENSWKGALDDVAIHRTLLSDEVLASRVDFGNGMPAVDWNLVTSGSVKVDVYNDLVEGHTWPQRMIDDCESFMTPSMALLDMPLRYVSGGSRDRRRATFIRMASRIVLDQEQREFLLRAPSLARLSVDGDVIAQLEEYQMASHAHQLMRPAVEEKPYPRARLGIRDVVVRFSGEQGEHEIVVEAIVGRESIRFTLGELLVASRKVGETTWHLLTPPLSEVTEFTPVGMEWYRQEEVTRFLSLGDARRIQARTDDALNWSKRHAAARAYVSGLPKLEVPNLPNGFVANNAVDHFLAAKIHTSKQSTDAHDPEAATAVSVLQKHCVRCHGKKNKGDLKLDTRMGALHGGESGKAAIVPGHPNESEILLRIEIDDVDDRMPPKGERLSEYEVSSLKKWIENGADWATAAQSVKLPPRLDDAAFLRRLSLDTIGIFPTANEIHEFYLDTSEDRIERRVKAWLQHPRHADHWTSYWQDVLAENPRLVKGKLNNTGPFRWWIYEALRDKLPFDQFVSELVALGGSPLEGGASGFKVATENDVPAAAKAHVIATAFLGTEMKCARCHDAPYHQSKQKDLFALAAMFEGKALKVPISSSVPNTFFKRIGDRESKVKVTLDSGTPVKPAWPFGSLSGKGPEDPRERLAWELTRPENRRFAQVIVNRVWKRYFGQGFVEPASDWEGNEPSHPELLDYLARDFVAYGYDIDRLSTLILTSEAYRREATLDATEERFFEAPMKRRLSAEQLVDSLFAATGVPVYSEELTLDVPGTSTAATFQNLGYPTRAWHFVSLASDRDRPSLTLPRADSIVSVMKAFGWRPDRPEPITVREAEATVLQPGMLANGVFSTWITRLSPFSDLTRIAIEAGSPDALTEALYWRFLGRKPRDSEREAVIALLSEGFESRLLKPANDFQIALFVPEVREVTWSNHLSPEANVYAAETERQVELGPIATDFLQATWRTCMEDVVWAIINAPEMQYIP